MENEQENIVDSLSIMYLSSDIFLFSWSSAASLKT